MVCVNYEGKHKEECKSKGKTPEGNKPENIREVIEESRRNT